jgi:hypothetical protein
MSEEFQPYQTVNQSRLEPWRNQIAEMRSLNWPYQKIADWLAQEAEVFVSLQAVHQFCKVRGIVKGSASKPPPPVSTAGPRVTPRKKKSAKPKPLFEYDGGDEPIDLSQLKTER